MKKKDVYQIYLFKPDLLNIKILWIPYQYTLLSFRGKIRRVTVLSVVYEINEVFFFNPFFQHPVKKLDNMMKSSLAEHLLKPPNSSGGKNLLCQNHNNWTHENPTHWNVRQQGHCHQILPCAGSVPCGRIPTDFFFGTQILNLKYFFQTHVWLEACQPTFTLSYPICPGKAHSLRGYEKAKESGCRRALWTSIFSA